MRVGRYFALFAGGTVLLSAMTICIWTDRQEKTDDRPYLALGERIPREIGGWVSKDLPLGDLEVQNAAIRLLNYDDYIYRVYYKGSNEVYVYAMYWRQGRISVREIAGHTPEGCWVANGAIPLGMKLSQRLSIDGEETALATARQFSFEGNLKLNAVWWHIWGSNLVDGEFSRKSILPALRELWVWLVKRRGVNRDQLLVRIHSRSDLKEVVKWAPVKVFLRQFPEVFTATPLND